jgi:hypothetical protein
MGAMVFDPGQSTLVFAMTDVFGMLQGALCCCPVIVGLKRLT